MKDPQQQRYRRKANDVIRNTLARIRDAEMRLAQMEPTGSEYVVCEHELAELRVTLSSMMALRKEGDE